MKHFLSTESWTRDELQSLLDRATELKRSPIADTLRNRTVALLFFNPSLRTRTSFEIGTFQLGGHAVILEPGKGAWPIEFEDGAVMLGEEEEHVREAARVLSRYCDLIAVRVFPRFVDWQIDRQDPVIRAVARHATVPVVNMETIVHPCQELALMQSIQERLGRQTTGRRFLLTWTYHPKGLNTAVANSALLIASKFGMDTTLLCPTEEYLLDEQFIDATKRQAAEQGASFRVTHDIEEGYTGAEVVYAKSWGALPFFGQWEQEKPLRDRFRHFIVDDAKMAMTSDALFSHCLPMRRNVKATDSVVDSERSMIIDEAENRLHVQKALLERLILGANK